MRILENLRIILYKHNSLILNIFESQLNGLKNVLI